MRGEPRNLAPSEMYRPSPKPEPPSEMPQPSPTAQCPAAPSAPDEPCGRCNPLPHGEHSTQTTWLCPEHKAEHKALIEKYGDAFIERKDLPHARP